MNRALLWIAVAGLGIAVALPINAQFNQPGGPFNFPPPSGGGGSLASITPSGGTSASDITALTGRILTPADFGAVGDTQRKSCTVTTAASSPTVTVTGTGCAFTSADIGKKIVIFDAGASLATAPIASAAVNAAGSAYTSIPTITITDATGAGAVLSANAGLDTATVVTGGATCTNGVQTFTVSGGTNTTPAQFTGTVTGNALSGALTVTVAGSYSALPSTTAASVTGGGCGTPPTISNTWHQVTPTLTFTGYNYTAPTAAYSAGTATLSNPVLATAGVNPLASTISNVAGTTLTLVDNASQTITTTAKQVTWGHDDAVAINALLSATAKGTGGAYAYAYFPPAPGGFWGSTALLNIAPGGFPSKIVGAGRTLSTVIALGPIAELVFQNQAAQGTIRDITFDGNKLTTYVARLNCISFASHYNVAFMNPAPYGTNYALGNPDGSSTCNSSETFNLVAGISDNFYAGTADQPLENVAINQTDSQHYGLFGYGAVSSNVHVGSAGQNTTMVNPHVYSITTAPTTGYLLDGWAHLYDPRTDGVQGQAIKINVNKVNVTGGYTNSPNAIANAVSIAASVADVNVIGYDCGSYTAPATQCIVRATPFGAHVNTFGNLHATDYSPLPSAPNSASVILGGNAGNALTTGDMVAMGGSALSSNITGVSNTAIGNAAGINYATGSNSIFVGAFAGNKVTGGSGDTIIGESALQGGASSVTAGGWTVVGNGAFNLAQGSTVAGAGLGANVCNKLTTGARALCLGNNVGSTTLATGSDVVLIGTNSSIDAPTSSTSNYIGIGAGSTAIWSVTGTNTPTTAIETFHGSVVYPDVASGTQNRCLGLTSGNALATSAGACGGAPGGTTGQIQYNNGGAFGGYTQGGDCTTDTSTGLITCLSLNSTTPGPFFAATWPTTADGLGSDGSSFLPWTFGTGFVKSGTVWSLTVPLNTQSGNSAYTILSTDAAKTVNRTNTVTQTDPVPQATGSFAAGFGFNYQTATVGNTLTSTTSTINGIAGATGIKLGPQQGADFFSDGTNWHAVLSVPQCATQTGTTFIRDDYTCAQIGIGTGVSGLGTGVATAAAANLSAAGGLTSTIASGTSALGTGAISSATCATVVTTAATNTATTDVVLASFNGDPTGVTGYIPATSGMLTIISYPTSGNVNFKVCNNTSSSITPGAITLNWRVVR